MRSYALFGTGDDWTRTADGSSDGFGPTIPAYAGTRFDPDRCSVMLAGSPLVREESRTGGPMFLAPVPIAADEAGTVFRVVPEGVGARLDVARRTRRGRWVRGTFVAMPRQRRALAACLDANGRLWIADGGDAIEVVEPATGHSVEMIGHRGVRDVVAVGDRVIALTGEALIEIDECRRWVRRPLHRPLACPLVQMRARRATVVDGTVLVLWRSPDGRAWVANPDGDVLIDELRWASDVERVGAYALVSGPPHARIDLLHRRADGWRMEASLDGSRFDGTGLVALPDDTVVAWPADADVPVTLPRVPVRYPTDGVATTGRLDSGDFQTVWGRIFIDACVPPGTQVEVATTSGDDDTPPPFGDFGPLSVRPLGSELPWRSAADGFRTLEAPVMTPPGRFLWVRVRLIGPGSVTPEIRQVRVEHPSHDLLQRLPRVYSQDPVAADFLRRLLAPAEAMLYEMDQLGWSRDFLLHAAVAPADTLAWLAGFVGLTVDDRWPLAARRRIIARAAALFARRGTPASLEEFCRLALDTDVVIVERFRLQGSGNAPSNRPVGTGWRVGDRLGARDTTIRLVDDELDLGAHCFVVVVWRELSDVEHDVLTQIMNLHRPAHTDWSVCTLVEGSSLGSELLGVTTKLGRSGFRPTVLGETQLGADRVLGAAEWRAS